MALVAIPQSLAYAELAGLPPQYGLYATALPSLLAALFVSSRYLQTGPVALTALLTLGALSAVAEPGEPDYIRSAALLALLVGLMRLLLGLVRFGRVAYLLSEPVVTGFTAGAAVVIIASQLPKIFDVESEGEVLAAAMRALGRPEGWNWTAIAFAAGTVVLMVGGRHVHRLFPGVLVAVIAGVMVSGFGGYAGSKVGDLDGGFIPLSLDFGWSAAPSLLLPAAVIALVGFAEPAAIARTFAAADRLPWNANREMVSQGVANLASAVSGAFPVGGSFSRKLAQSHCRGHQRLVGRDHRGVRAGRAAAGAAAGGPAHLRSRRDRDCGGPASGRCQGDGPPAVRLVPPGPGGRGNHPLHDRLRAPRGARACWWASGWRSPCISTASCRSRRPGSGRVTGSP